METLQTAIAKLYTLTRSATPLGDVWPIAIRKPSGKVSKYPNLAAVEDALRELGDLSRIKDISLDQFGIAIVTFYPQDVLPL